MGYSAKGHYKKISIQHEVPEVTSSKRTRSKVTKDMSQVMDFTREATDFR